MPSSTAGAAPEKTDLHPRNRHRGRYNFDELTALVPELAAFVGPSEHQAASIDFANPAAVKALNKALLRRFYQVVSWDIPAGYLVPPIPGRADYMHYAADLLGSANEGVVPTGRSIRVLDIGVGANCIYPLIGHHEYGWKFVGADADPVAVRMARQIAASNPALGGAVEIRLQPKAADIFHGVVKPGEVYDLTICNPPFHGSAAEALAAGRRKERNLGTAAEPRTPNFAGQATELWYPGGEATFLWRLAEESRNYGPHVAWFTTLVSRKETLPGLYKTLKKLQATDVQTIAMHQGQKSSRLVAWTFLTPEQQQAWRTRRWAGAPGLAAPAAPAA